MIIHAVVGDVGRIRGHSKRGKGRSRVTLTPTGGIALIQGRERARGGEAARPADCIYFWRGQTWTSEGHGIHAHGGARRGDCGLLLGVALARLGQTGRDAALEIGNNLWGGVAVERGVGWLDW